MLTPLPSACWLSEHVTNETYTGFTKKGMRFSWDKLREWETGAMKLTRHDFGDSYTDNRPRSRRTTQRLETG